MLASPAVRAQPWVAPGRLALPHPQVLPSTRSALRRAAVSLGAPSLRELATGSAQAARGVRWDRPSSASPPAPTREPRESRERDYEEHDRYFRVARVGGESALEFLRGVVLAHMRAYDDACAMGTTLLDENEWHRLFLGLRRLFELALGRDERPIAFPGRSDAWRRDAYDPDRRWLIGHQLFFAQIQAVIVGLNLFERAAAGGDVDEASAGLELATAFMHSSAAAMKLTSDFAPADYEAHVRPAMAPPNVRAGFSGLQTRDHAFLVQSFGRLRPLLTGPHADRFPHDHFVDSVAAAYAAHEFVCARFRGDVLPSLRMAAVARGGLRPTGVDVVREMMRARLGLIDGK